MHDAPSVTYPVGRSAWLALWLGLVWLGGALACAAWAWPAAGGGPTVGLALVVLCGWWVARWWWRQPAGRLACQAGCWNWLPAAGQGAQGRVDAALDLQVAMLLRWQAHGQRAGWLWVERSRRPQRWAALRRAVYSRADADALPGAKPPSARP